MACWRGGRIPRTGGLLVELTPNGIRHVEDWRAFQRQLAEDVMAPLGPAQRRQLMSLLEQIRTEGLEQQAKC